MRRRLVHEEVTGGQNPAILLLDAFDSPGRQAPFFGPILVKFRLPEKNVPAAVSNDQERRDAEPSGRNVAEPGPVRGSEACPP